MRALIFSIILCSILTSCFDLEPSSTAAPLNIDISAHSQQDPLLYQFSAQFPNHSPNNINWDFRDGYSSNSYDTSHHYQSPGNYQAIFSYTIDGQPHEKTIALKIAGEVSKLIINTRQAITLDSDNNDVNQPYLSNNTLAQPLIAPIQVSGILMKANACQVGRLCENGDLNDRYTFDLEYGDSIQLDMIKGTVNFSITHESNSPPQQTNNISSSLTIPAHQLGQGQYMINIELDDSEDRAQYLLNIAPSNPEALASKQNYQPGKLIVLWKENTVPELMDISDPRLAQAHNTNINTIQQRLVENPEVASVSLNYIRRSQNSNLQWPLNFQNIESLWEPLALRGESPGTNSTVAVIDTGIYSQHPNLKGLTIRDGYDFISDPINALDGDGWDSNPEDPGDNQLSYHGTHVTGIIAAQPNNDLSATEKISGLASSTNIMPLRVLGADGGTSYDLIQAMRYAAGLKNQSGLYPSQPTDIINLSLGGIQFSAAEQATIDEVINSGVIIVAASGNQGRDQVNYPAAYQNVIAVGASNNQGQVSSYSNTGQFLDLMAPGGECLDAYCLTGITSLGANGQLRSTSDQRIPALVNFAGTSMAAAHVSALLSIARSELPALDAHALTNLKKNGDLTENTQDSSTPFNKKTGWGWLSSHKILKLMDTSELNQGGIWVNARTLHIPPLTNAHLPIILRGHEEPAILQVQSHSSELQAHIEGETLFISSSQFFDKPSSITISSINLRSLTIQINPTVNTLGKSNIHHLYLKANTDANSLDIGRASRQTNGWQAFIEQTIPLESVQASTDIDYDGVYCEPGELCAYSDGKIKPSKEFLLDGQLLSH